MPTSYTNLLGLALPTTGELSGTWGTTVNDYITQYVDASVAGVQTISGSQTAVTLSKTTGGSLVSAGSGATGSSQYAIINCTGNPAGLLTITAPAASKAYLIINATSTSQQVKIVGVGPTTGVTINSATRAVVAWNGSDFVLVASDNLTQLNGVLTAAKGGTGQSSYTIGDILYASSSTALSKLADVATGNALISGGVGVAPSWGKIGLTTHVTGTLPVANGGTGAATFTANNVLLGNGTSAFQVVAPGTAGNVLTSNGTTWTSTTGVSLTGNNTFTGANSFQNVTGQTFLASTTTTQDGVIINGRAGGTSTYRVTLTPTTLSASRTLTLPDATTTVAGTDATQTLTNKRIDPRVVSATSASSLTPDVSAADMYAYTALAAGLTINAPTGTPVNGTKLMFRILDNGTSRTLTWNATYTAIGVVLPTATVASKMLYVGCIYNAANTRWDVIAVTTQL
jgi:hypothetical protein